MRTRGNRCVKRPPCLTACFMRKREAAYDAFWKRHQNGLPPDIHIA